LIADLESLEAAPLAVPDVRGWTTTRQTGSFGFGTDETVRTVFERWEALQAALRAHGVERLACASQVHGADVAIHSEGWTGWLRLPGIDGHVTMTPGTAMAVTVADCTPVFIAHPGGAAAVLHAGWRGLAAGILERGLAALESLGFSASEARVHLGPSICGQCYEVGPEVLEAVLGVPATTHGMLDVKAELVRQASRIGVHSVDATTWCTRCDNDRFFSHRAADAGRQLGIIALLPR
jgi:YfiH family protein